MEVITIKARLIGYSKLDFQSGSGEQIKGYSLYISYPQDNVIGERTDKVFVREEIEIPKVKVGDMLNLSFNVRGKLESINL